MEMKIFRGTHTDVSTLWTKDFFKLPPTLSKQIPVLFPWCSVSLTWILCLDLSHAPTRDDESLLKRPSHFISWFSFSVTTSCSLSLCGVLNTWYISLSFGILVHSWHKCCENFLNSWTTTLYSGYELSLEGDENIFKLVCPYCYTTTWIYKNVEFCVLKW